MKSKVTVVAIILSLTLGLSGCAENMRKMSSALEEFNTGVKHDNTTAVQPEASQSTPTKLVMPSDKVVALAVNEALPTIKKVLAIHQCIRDFDSIRQLNKYALDGVNLVGNIYMSARFPNSGTYMPYHNLNKCVSVRAIDMWFKPALNALFFRAVYFADDSGETINFVYLMQKTDEGSWRIAEFKRE